ENHPRVRVHRRRSRALTTAPHPLDIRWPAEPAPATHAGGVVTECTLVSAYVATALARRPRTLAASPHPVDVCLTAETHVAANAPATALARWPRTLAASPHPRLIGSTAKRRERIGIGSAVAAKAARGPAISSTLGGIL